MTVDLILDEAWESYEEYKVSRGQNPGIFIPGDRYEFNFLVNRIITHYPQYTDLAIERSINAIKRTLYAGCKRRLFVDLVISHLLQHQPLENAG